MAKGKYEYWLSEDGLTLLEGWARDGLTDEQIATNMGISRSTLAKWKELYSDISDALKKGKEVVDYQVENALLESALNGNITAQIFWLKNRKAERWRDKPPEKADSSVDNNLLSAIENSTRDLEEEADDVRTIQQETVDDPDLVE